MFILKNKGFSYYTLKYCQQTSNLLIYSNLTNEEKLEKAKTNLKLIFDEKNIKVTELELRFLIESSVRCFKPDNLENYIKEIKK